MKNLILLLVASLVALPALAGDYRVHDITPAGSVEFPVLAPAGVFTSAPITMGDATAQGLSWYHVTASGSPSVNVIVLQANAVGDTLTQWSAPFAGTVTTDVTITTARGGSSLALASSRLVAFQVTNSGSQNVTPTMRLLAR